MSNFFTQSNMIGVDLNNSNTAPQFGLNSIAFGTGDTEWVYAYVSGAVSTGSAVTLSTTGTASLATPTTVATGSELVFAQASFADATYAWFARRGNPLTVLVSATSTLQVQLYVSATSGAITTTSTSGTIIGVSLLTASTTAANANFLAMVSWPKASAAGN